MADKFTVEEAIAAVRKNKGILSLAARELGCTRQTMHRYVNKYASVKDEVNSQRDDLLDMTEAKLFEQVQAGNITAIIFTLKTLGKARGYVERQEITGADGGKIQITHDAITSKLLPELTTPDAQSPAGEAE